MSDYTLIDANGLYRYYGRLAAIHDVSFNVKRGEIVGILGPNGAGKSTLLQILCGVLAASRGTVSIAGWDILAHPRRAKRHLGYLPEQLPVYPDCTVDEYLFYCARLRGVARPRLAEAVTAGKQKCGLADTGNRLIGNLSKGYRQRAGLAQAIVPSPDVIILDEPGSGLDPGQQADMRELIRDMGREHSVILSTHSLAEAQATCGRVLIMHQGKISLDLDMESLGGRPGLLEQTYLGLAGDRHGEDGVT